VSDGLHALLRAVTQFFRSGVERTNRRRESCFEQFAETQRDGTGVPEVSSDFISLNGDAEFVATDGMCEDDMSHETFFLSKLSDPDNWNFCKTARKPCDLVVCAILLLAVEIAPGALGVSSDGEMSGDDWQPARDLIRKLSPEFRSLRVQASGVKRHGNKQ
jgi:hypothetical protein